MRKTDRAADLQLRRFWQYNKPRPLIVPEVSLRARFQARYCAIWVRRGGRRTRAEGRGRREERPIGDQLPCARYPEVSRDPGTRSRAVGRTEGHPSAESARALRELPADVRCDKLNGNVILYAGNNLH
jgi:hypothetical protein